MTAHERASQLAALAIDFDLDPTERQELDGHLAGCADCRRFATGIRSDAGHLRAIASRPAPLQVRLAIAEAAANPAGAWSPLELRASWQRLALVLALVAALLVGLIAASLLVGARPQLGVVRSTPPPIPTAQATIPSPIAATVGQTIAVCPDAGDLAAGSGALWFTCATDTWRADIPAGTSAIVLPAGGPTAPTPDAVWAIVANGVARLEPRTGAVVARVTFIGAATVAADATSVWLTNASAGTAGTTSTGTVAHIDPVTNQVLATVNVGWAPADLVLADRAVWVTNRSSDSVTRIDPATNHAVATIRVGKGPRRIAAAAGSIWVANSEDGTVSRIDPATNAARTIAIDPTRSPGILPAIAGLPDGTVWVVDSRRETLVEIDPTTNTVVRQLSFPVAGGQRSLDSLAVLDGSLWVVDLSGSLLRVEIPAS